MMGADFKELFRQFNWKQPALETMAMSQHECLCGMVYGSPVEKVGDV
jgi:hypothetical protein